MRVGGDLKKKKKKKKQSLEILLNAVFFLPDVKRSTVLDILQRSCLPCAVPWRWHGVAVDFSSSSAWADTCWTRLCSDHTASDPWDLGAVSSTVKAVFLGKCHRFLQAQTDSLRWGQLAAPFDELKLTQLWSLVYFFLGRSVPSFSAVSSWWWRCDIRDDFPSSRPGWFGHNLSNWKFYQKIMRERVWT